MLKCNILLFNSGKNLHALLKYQHKSQRVTFYVYPVHVFYGLLVPFYAQNKFSGVIIAT